MRGRRTIGRVLRAGRMVMHTERPLILMYHRVDNLAVDPWQLAVSPAYFEQQIEMLSQERKVVPMSWLAGELRKGRLPRRTAAITFDDAYADVLHNALPVLQRHDCSATVYAVSKGTGGHVQFWWDRLADVFFSPPILPKMLAIDIEGRPTEIKLEGDRMSAFVSLHAELKRLRPGPRNKAMADLQRWAGYVDQDVRGHAPMSAGELRRLSQDGRIEIGAHSMSHPSLPLLGEEELVREISGSRREIEAQTGAAICGFAYPYGDQDVRCREAVAAAGMSYAVTAEERAVRAGDDLFSLPRIVVADWDAQEFRRRLTLHA